MKRVFNVAAFVCGMDEEYPYQIIQGINEFAREHAINVSYFASFGGIVENSTFDDGEYSIYKLPNFAKFDGALLLTNTFSNPVIRNAIIDRVKAVGIPSVIFECKDYEEFYDVSIDNYAVMKKLVEHLIKAHGAKTFNFISGPEANPEAKARYQAFRDALAENGLDFDEDKRLFKGFFRSYDGIRAIEEFFHSGLSLPDAFVCANDSMALTAMNKLQANGIKVPDDVIVTGFDNTFNARNSFPVLTTVKRPLFSSGVKSCEVLYSLMRGEGQPRSTIMDAEPVYAESCGCQLKNDENALEFRKETSIKIERTYTGIHILNRLIAALAIAKNIDECSDAIKKWLEAIDCNDFALCLVSDWEKTYNTVSLEEQEDNYPAAMTAPLIWDHGERRAVKSFPSKQLMPEMQMSSGNISYYIPLHFGPRILGYYIMTNTDFPIYSNHCHTITMCIGNAIESISKLNVLDPLCGIYNRNGFNINAGYIFDECVREQSAISVIFIDVDGLKVINDTYGHKEGDATILAISDTIELACGAMDVCGRIGGDEFVIVGRGEGFAKIFEDRFNAELERKNNSSDKPYLLDASIGHITSVPEESDTLLEFIQQADAEMYQVKKTKKNHR